MSLVSFHFFQSPLLELKCPTFSRAGRRVLGDSSLALDLCWGLGDIAGVGGLVLDVASRCGVG